MEQLEIDLGEIPVNKPHSGHNCPYCKQSLNKKHILLSWKSFREWLLKHWQPDHEKILRENEPHKLQDLEDHPDLVYALRLEASYERVSIRELLAQIVDGYFSGKSERLIRRKKILGKNKAKDGTVIIKEPVTEGHREGTSARKKIKISKANKT